MVQRRHMNDDLNSGKAVSPGGGRYYHGALRPALIRAAVEVLAERGPDGFSLRETARRAGVSPAAPAHHFGDARGLLTAIATEAFRDFGDALAAADKGADRAARIRAQGVAYVRFALDDPARFHLMWRKALLDTADPEYAETAHRAFLLLDGVVRGEEAALSVSPRDLALAPSIACWSIVHGFAMLALDGTFGDEPDRKSTRLNSSH